MGAHAAEPVSLGEPALEVVAWSLASDRRDPTLLPSERYMACLIAGAEEHGLPRDYVAWLGSLPTCAETPDAIRFRGLMDEVLATREKPRGT